jgi:hypothetical protein
MNDDRAELGRRLELLERSCREYDGGRRQESATIATALRDLFHQAGGTPSLLARAGSRYIKLLSTAAGAPTSRSGGDRFGLVTWDLNPAASIFECRPKLAASKATDRFVPYTFWWDEEAIYQHGHRKVRRRDLVVQLADGAGDLIDGRGWPLVIRPAPGPEREVALHFADSAALRQIAYEALASPELRTLGEGGRS